MIIYVNNSEEAKNYPVMFNSAEILMNSNSDLFYVKSVDNIGKAGFATYKFERVEDEKPTAFATVEQFEALSNKLDTIIKELGGITNE